MSCIKLAIICHFSNQSIRDKLSLFKWRIYRYFDFGKWVTNILDAISRYDEFEVHVISPHRGMKSSFQEFEDNNIHYYFYRDELPFPFGKLENLLFSQEKRNYPRIRKIVKRIIKKINPNIVNLIGAENPYYSITALDIENIPIILHCQTVYANPNRIRNAGEINQKRWNLEIELFHKIPYIACSGKMYYDLIKKYEPNAIIFPRKWPVSKFPDIPEVNKRYDFAYFARMLNKNKGFDDAIEAISIVANKYPNIKILAVGNYENNQTDFEKRIKDLNIDKNIEIHRSFEKYEDMLTYVKQARFALLPIKMDVISGTILEAMRMGMPVVTSRTSGTPTLNSKQITVLISDIGDYNRLADNMIRLYEDSELTNKLINNANSYIRELDEKNSHNIEIMISQYKAVIAHYDHGTPIPEDLLYDIKSNIDYSNNENKIN